MAIKKIKISNFKSFKNLEIELDKFNVLIGANASGKSNFIQIFKFLRDISNHGLDNAISMQGGIEYLRNVNIGASEDLSMEVVLDCRYAPPIVEIEKKIENEKKSIVMEVHEAIIKFTIKFNKNGFGYEIVENKLIQKVNIIRSDYIKSDIHKKKCKENEKFELIELIISNVNGKIDVNFSKLPEDLQIEKDDIFPPFLRQKRLEPKSLIFENGLFFFMPPIFKSTSIYDFDPKLPKKATSLIGKLELEEDGGNLAIVLKNIMEDDENTRKFSNLMKYLLPFVDSLDVKKHADRSLIFRLSEIYNKKQYIPAFFISDGTINITALIIGLYFEKKSLTIIEEPERNIHPHLIFKVAEMMKDASEKKQIIVTTHNPEMIKHIDLKNILLVSRDKDGFSIISKPHEKESVKIFLQNELGIEELYVQNLLELEL